MSAASFDDLTDVTRRSLIAKRLAHEEPFFAGFPRIGVRSMVDVAAAPATTPRCFAPGSSRGRFDISARMIDRARLLRRVARVALERAGSSSRLRATAAGCGTVPGNSLALAADRAAVRSAIQELADGGPARAIVSNC